MPDLMQFEFRLEIDEAARHAPRATLLASYVEWLQQDAQYETMPATHGLLALLPADVIRIRLRAKNTLPGRRIGAFRIGSAASPTRRWQIDIAYGPDFQDSTVVWNWLHTLPHELVHLAYFARRTRGRVPSELTLAEFKAETGRSVLDFGTEEDLAERWGEAAGFDYVRTHPELFDDPDLLAGVTTLMKKGSERAPRSKRRP